MNIRKNARWLSNDERNNFLKAVVTLKTIKKRKANQTMRLYDFYPLEHRVVRHRVRKDNGLSAGDGGHRGPGFPVWHREWLRRFELDLRDIDSSVTLPYWDIVDLQGSQDVIFQPSYMGGNGTAPNFKIESGIFREFVPEPDRPDWWPDDDGAPLSGFPVMQSISTLEMPFKQQPIEFNVTGLTRNFGNFKDFPDRAGVRVLLDRTPYFRSANRFATFSAQIEGAAYHVPGHSIVGGLMSRAPTSPNDPIFFLHHCGVDLIWALWQARNSQANAENLPPARSDEIISDVQYSHYLDDFLWPWDGTSTTNPDKLVPPHQAAFRPANPNDRPPIFPRDTFMRDLDSTDIVRVGNVIDHHNLGDGTGYQYDVEIPYNFKKDGMKLAQIEPYFGDLNLTGQVREFASGSASPADLPFKINGSVQGWIETASGNLHLNGAIVPDETNFSDVALQGTLDFRHFNQPLAYLDSAGNLHLKGRVETNQPPIT